MLVSWIENEHIISVTNYNVDFSLRKLGKELYFNINTIEKIKAFTECWQVLKYLTLNDLYKISHVTYDSYLFKDNKWYYWDEDFDNWYGLDNCFTEGWEDFEITEPEGNKIDSAKLIRAIKTFDACEEMTKADVIRLIQSMVPQSEVSQTDQVMVVGGLDFQTKKSPIG